MEAETVTKEVLDTNQAQDTPVSEPMDHDMKDEPITVTAEVSEAMQPSVEQMEIINPSVPQQVATNPADRSSPARATSNAPSTTTTAPPPQQPPAAHVAAPPTQPIVHGSPARVYLNQNVTPYLLEGMKYLAVYEPEKPLQWLSEYLAKKSRELEGT